MNIIDRAAIINFHKARIEAFGAGTTSALGWKTPASQRLRFDVLAEIANLNDHTVLDVGCGHGDLRAHIDTRYPRVHYAGIDQMQAFLDVAAAKYGDCPNTTFYLGDFSTTLLPEADYVLASGAMGYRSSDPEFVLQMIKRLFTACRIGLGFNLLRRIEGPGQILAAHDPELILRHCRALTPHAIFRQDYLPDDFTVLMYKSAPQ